MAASVSVTSLILTLYFSDTGKRLIIYAKIAMKGKKL